MGVSLKPQRGPASLWVLPFGIHINEGIEDIPRRYLLWLLEQEWFAEKYKEGVIQINKELEYRDRWGDDIED